MHTHNTKKSVDPLSCSRVSRVRGKAFRPVLFSNGRRSTRFFTEDSGLYITPQQSILLRTGYAVLDRSGYFDAVHARVEFSVAHEDYLFLDLRNRFDSFWQPFRSWRSFFSFGLSPTRLAGVSMASAVLFGMFSMTMVYRYLGQSVSASSGSGSVIVASASVSSDISYVRDGVVLGAEDVSFSDNIGSERNLVASHVANFDFQDLSSLEQLLGSIETATEDEFARSARELVEGHPIEKMLPYILEKDRIVAAFLIGIAKKESNWGKRHPVLNGNDCYNYWGYRGKRRLMGSGGHTCFNSRKDAVDTVAKRIEWLVLNQDRTTPEDMIIWKCGYSCDGHDPESVRKWISDVSLYFDKLNQ